MIFYVLYGLIALGVGYNNVKYVVDSHRYPPPGRLVDIGGRRPGATTLGIDGIGHHEGAVIAIQNGVTPARAMRFGLDPEGQRLMYATVLDRNSAIADEPMGTPGSRMKRSSSRQRITGCCCIESWMARDGILSTRRGTFRPRCRPFVSLPANSVIDRGTDRARYMDEPPRLTHTSTMNTSFAMVLVALTVACSASPSPKPEPDVAPGPDAQIVVAARRDSTVRVVLTAIQGREALPAESVFVNIRNFRGMPAGRLLQIMTGFSASLGVGCDHCHVPGDWASETKPTKQIARDMGVMVSRLQRELLRPIPGLAGRTPTVTCVTCHNGRVKPMTRLAAPARP